MLLVFVAVLQGDAYDAFISVAQKSEDAVFVQTTKKDVAKAAGLSSAGVAVITNFEGGCWLCCASVTKLSSPVNQCGVLPTRAHALCLQSGP